jgi:hypothetical protein
MAGGEVTDPLDEDWKDVLQALDCVLVLRVQTTINSAPGVRRTQSGPC